MADGNVLSLNISKRKSLVSELREPVYRHAFIEAHAKDTIAFQLRRMREAKGWTQGQLALEAFGDPKLQSMVSRLENPDYGKYSVSTLLGLAKIFDVGLVVRFAPFSEVVDWDLTKTEPTLEPPPFAQDKALEEIVSPITVPSVTESKQPTVNVYNVSINSGLFQNLDSVFSNTQIIRENTARRTWQNRKSRNLRCTTLVRSSRLRSSQRMSTT